MVEKKYKGIYGGITKERLLSVVGEWRYREKDDFGLMMVRTIDRYKEDQRGH